KLSKRPVNVPKTVRLTNGLTCLERETRLRQTAGPGPARVLVRPGEAWSHPRGTLGRCLKGSEINIQCFKYYIFKFKYSVFFITKRSCGSNPISATSKVLKIHQGSKDFFFGTLAYKKPGRRDFLPGFFLFGWDNLV